MIIERGEGFGKKLKEVKMSKKLYIDKKEIKDKKIKKLKMFFDKNVTKFKL